MIKIKKKTRLINNNLAFILIMNINMNKNNNNHILADHKQVVLSFVIRSLLLK